MVAFLIITMTKNDDDDEDDSEVNDGAGDGICDDAMLMLNYGKGVYTYDKVVMVRTMIIAVGVDLYVGDSAGLICNTKLICNRRVYIL